MEQKYTSFKQEIISNPYFTPVNVVFVMINVIVYLILAILGHTTDAAFMWEHGAMHPYSVLVEGEWYRLFTCGFLHFGMEHLINNMVMLVCIGSYMEKALGKVKYIILYLLSLVGSSMISLGWMICSERIAVSAGASGVVFAMIGALLWIIFRHKGRYKNLPLRRYLIMIALSLYYGFSTAGVDNAAHIGGLIVGFVLCMLLYHRKDTSNMH